MIEEGANVAQIDENLAKIDKALAEMMKPLNFVYSDPENAVVSLEMGYENLCSMLALNGVNDVKSLTIFEFYSRIKYYKNSMMPKK